MVKTKWGAATDTGCVRSENEDAFLAEFPVFIVADGMGGYAGGEVASRCAVDAFNELASRTEVTDAEVRSAIDRANESVITTAWATSGLEEMGTTLVGLVLITTEQGPRWAAFNIGDSRLYRLFDGTLSQVSVDHSAVQELVTEGVITASEARVHPNRNIVTRSLGVDRPVEPDLWLLEPTESERFLVCSDGLSGDLVDAEIGILLRGLPDPEEAAKALVTAAVAAGGRDNITAVVVDTESLDS